MEGASQNHFATPKGRHGSVVPYNKSIYSKNMPQTGTKTFFKGAVEYLLSATERSSLADGDHTLKKILGDSKVQKRYSEAANRSKEEDLANSGVSLRTSKVGRPDNLALKAILQQSRQSFGRAQQPPTDTLTQLL